MAKDEKKADLVGGGARDRPMPQATTSTKKFDDIGDLGRIRFGGPEWVIK